MKLVRFGDPCRERPGILADAETIVDVSSPSEASFSACASSA